MRKKGQAGKVLAITLLASAAVLMASCGKKKTTIEVTTPAAETSAPARPEPKAVPETTAVVTEAPTEAANPVSIKLKTSIATYQKDGVSISYPVVSGMDDTSLQDRLNAHLKENALSILENYPDSKEPLDQEKDTLEIKCSVVSADMNRVTAVYEGTYMMDKAAHPNNLFYTNTVDTKTLKDVSLNDAADPYSMAAYALAEDVVLRNADPEIEKAYREWQPDMTIDQYKQCLEKADFPLKKGSDGKTVTWPDSFSYESEGALFFSIPVPHALGDYVIVEYDMTTK